jgi:hypothetical protein
MARRGPAEIVQINLRLPESLRRRLAGEARQARRSLNQEMVLRLEQTFNRVDADAILERAEALMEGVDQLNRKMEQWTYHPSPQIQVPDVARLPIAKTLSTKERKK